MTMLRFLAVLMIVRVCLFQVIRKETFKFGVEYAVTGLGEAYSKTGSLTTKPQPELIHWGTIQKKQSSSYDFSTVDVVVKEYQDAGFENMQLILYGGNSWAQIDSTHQNPKPQYEADYVKFVEATVDRYNLNGKSPMPGLKYSVREWAVEREFSGYYLGNGTEYVHLLSLASPAIRSTNPDAKVLLNALILTYVFQGNPNKTVIAERTVDPIPGFGTGKSPKTWNDVHVLLDATDLYDTVDFHFLGDYSEIPATLKWVGEELENRGVKKEVYGGDVFPMYTLFIWTLIYNCVIDKDIQLSYPVSRSSCKDAQETISARIQTKNDQHELAVQWFETQTSLNVPKKFVTAAAEGLSGLNMGNLEDWPIIPGFAGSSFFGMMDTNLTLTKRIPGETRPSFMSLKALIEKLSNFESVEKVASTSSDILLYKFLVNGSGGDFKKMSQSKVNNYIWVGWVDEGEVFYGLGTPLPSNRTVVVDVPKDGVYLVEVAPTVRKQDYSANYTVQSSGGQVKLDLGYIPTFMQLFY